jgi:small-conductance mechanosensitive channel
MQKIQDFFISLQQDIAFLQFELFGNAVSEYAAAIGVFSVAIIVFKFIKTKIVNNLNIVSSRIKGDYDDLVVQILQSIGWPVYTFFALGIAVQFIEQPEMFKATVSFITFLVAAYVAVRAVQQVIEFFLSRGIRERLKEDPRFDPSVVHLMTRGLKGLVWVVALLVVLDNRGFDITALMAGLGIGGLAIAFALQNVLSDVFASFSLYLDKPFKTGDFIIVDDFLGTVRHIGIKSTRIESLWGEEVIMPNKYLTEAKVKNYKRMENRRIVFEFGVVYQTPAAKMRKIPEIVQSVINGIELAGVDRVHWKGFGDSALTFEVMYRVNSPDYNQYMDVQQEINLQLKEKLEKEGIDFAYPTQTVYLQKS